MRACESVLSCGSGAGRSIVCVLQASSSVGWLSLSPGEGRGVLVIENNSVALTAVLSHQGIPGVRSVTA